MKKKKGNKKKITSIEQMIPVDLKNSPEKNSEILLENIEKLHRNIDATEAHLKEAENSLYNKPPRHRK